MHFKLIFYTQLMVLLLQPFNLCQAQNSLIVRFNDGTENVTSLSSLNKITFSDSKILINKKELGTNSFATSTISKITFGIFSAIPAILTDQTLIIIYPNPTKEFIRLRNIPEDKFQVYIYSTNGTLLKNCILTDKTSPIDVSDLDKGFYLLKVNNQILKLAKQ